MHGCVLNYGQMEGIERLEPAVHEQDRLNAIDGMRP